MDVRPTASLSGLLVALAVLTSGASAAAGAGCAREPGLIPNGGVLPGEMAPAAEGGVWFIESPGLPFPGRAAACVGLMDATGTLREFGLGLPAGSTLADIAPDGAGGAWVLPMQPARRIARITPTGAVSWTSYSPDYATHSWALAADGRGGAWFALNDASVGHVASDGTVSLHPTAPLSALAITGARDGGVWMIAGRSGGTGPPTLAHLAPDGSLTTGPAGALQGAGAGEVAAAPDGSVWLIDPQQDGALVLVRVADGVATRFPLRLPQADSAVHGLVAGPDGDMWFTVSSLETGDAGVGRITPGGAVTVFRRGLRRFSDPHGITVTSAGQLWFTEFSAARLGRITTEGVITENPSSPLVRGVTRTPRAVTIRMRCPAGAWSACRGVVRLRAIRAPGRLGPGAGRHRYALDPGARGAVTVRLARTATRALRRDGVLRVAVLIRAASPATGHLGDETRQDVGIRR